MRIGRGDKRASKNEEGAFDSSLPPSLALYLRVEGFWRELIEVHKAFVTAKASLTSLDFRTDFSNVPSPFLSYPPSL